MGVKVRRVTCLSLDSVNEKYYSKKLFVDDLVTLFLVDNKRLQGRVVNLGKSSLRLVDNFKNTVDIDYDKITTFNIDFRGTVSRDMF